MEPIFIVIFVGAVALLFALKNRATGKLGIESLDVPNLPNSPEPQNYPQPFNAIQLIRQISANEGYDKPELAIAIASQESSLNPNANNPEISGTRGDQPDSVGLMGLQYATAKKFVPEITSIQDLFNPVVNATAGIRYLQYLERKWSAIDVVIQMYNLGETRYLSGSRATNYLLSVKQKAGYA